MEESVVIGVQDDDYVYYNKDFKEKLMQRIGILTKEEAKQIGISNWQFYYLKKKHKNNELPKFKKKTLEKFRKIL